MGIFVGRPTRNEAALAVGLFAFGCVEVATVPGHRPVLFAAMAVQTLSLAWRRAVPVAAAALSLGGVAIELGSGERRCRTRRGSWGS